MERKKDGYSREMEEDKKDGTKRRKDEAGEGQR